MASRPGRIIVAMFKSLDKIGNATEAIMPAIRMIDSLKKGKEFQKYMRPFY